MGKISGQNSVIWFFGQYRKSGQKLSKKVITGYQRSMGTNVFKLYLAPLRSLCGPNMSSNGECHLGWFPREWNETYWICMYQVLFRFSWCGVMNMLNNKVKVILQKVLEWSKYESRGSKRFAYFRSDLGHKESIINWSVQTGIRFLSIGLLRFQGWFLFEDTGRWKISVW
jgi:hypothetical protein